MNTVKPLYPEIEPYATYQLQVSDLHTLYVEECGNPEGIPVVYLHGGPGVGTKPLVRRYFNPQQFRAVLYSQRGAPLSTPLGELRQNDTWELVEDLEKIRKKLKIDQWFVFGGSWGSTLALVYAIKHPERVLGIILRGIFLGRQQEIDWLYQAGGASMMFPDRWKEFQKMIPAEEQHEMVKAYQKRLNVADFETKLKYAKPWCAWEDDIIRLIPSPPAPNSDEDLIAFARIENHYMINHLFFPHENYILAEAHRICHLPCWIAQGRYDVICTPFNAYELKQALPNAELHYIPDAGHSMTEPGIASSLMQGLEKLASKINYK